MPFERDFAWNVGFTLSAKNPSVNDEIEVGDVGVLVVP